MNVPAPTRDGPRPHPLVTLLLVALVTLLTLVLGPAVAGGASAAPPAGDPVGVWPLSPEPSVLSGFDPPDSAYGAGHRGVDLEGTLSQQVRAALPGRITFAGSLAGRGVVVVDHGTTRTTYEPVAARVALGARVTRGATIGVLQLPGSHCFPQVCLHWGWIEGETYLDPLRLVGGGPVRLLPLWGDLPGPAATARRTTIPTPAAPVSRWHTLMRLLRLEFSGWIG